ncbi:hypothetical protein [Bradyrhizobium altum]|uniref:hypothetical protein n=1 Tax=Bradyrhizobium altum TaxID=1571202 RepID=UPI001E391318|nr:hypothetical protein [Bradyrhizobium altum]
MSLNVGLQPHQFRTGNNANEWPYLSGRFKWEKGLREVQDEAILHSTVLERFAHNGGVQHCYERMPYRPENLRSHAKVKKYYGAEDSTSNRTKTISCPAPPQSK